MQNTTHVLSRCKIKKTLYVSTNRNFDFLFTKSKTITKEAQGECVMTRGEAPVGKGVWSDMFRDDAMAREFTTVGGETYLVFRDGSAYLR